MDQIPLVNDRIDAGRRLVGQLSAHGVEVLAAAWVRPSEEGSWKLYLATPEVDATGLQGASRRIHPVWAREAIPAISASELRLIGARHPITTELLGMDKSSWGLTGTWFVGPKLGDLQIDEAYVYPKPPPPVVARPGMTSDEIVRKVTELMNRPGVAQPAVVALRNNTSFQGIPFGLEKSPDGLTLKFIETASGYIRSVPASDVASVT